MKKEIKIKNRYGYDHTFRHVKDNVYQFYADCYLRLFYEHNDDETERKIKGFDPDGGPLMYVGMEIEGMKIKSIFEDNGLMVEFEK